MKQNINSKHICSMVVYTLFSLFLCMAGVGNASAAEINPVVKNVTFLPKVCQGEETVCGLTTTNAADGRFFYYQTTDGTMVNISKKDFGANVVAHKVVDGKCVIEFDAPITKIPAYAFCNCKNLTGNLVIPNSVTEIGDYAFFGCSGFTGNLTIPNSVTTIGFAAFYECSGFTGDLTISNSVTTIGESAFR